jgi:hypothetical protein
VQPFLVATGIENSYPTIVLPDGDVDRKLRPVGRACAQLIHDWRSHVILGTRVAF